MENYSKDYLLGKKVAIYQPNDGYRASVDAVFVASSVPFKKNAKILDVGAGTGAISLCLAKRFLDCEVCSLEIQERLADFIENSAKENGFENRVRVINCDISKLEKQIEPNSFDFVVTNPPYSSSEMMVSPNLSKARAHNESSVDLEKWLKFCVKMLKPRGTFCMIHRADRLDEILHVLYKKVGAIEVIPMFSKKGRETKRVIVRARKGVKTPFKMSLGITIHEADGGYTKEANDILVNAKAMFD
jgi:FkbM family methyltransferase